MNHQKLSIILGLIIINTLTGVNFASANIGKVLLSVGDVNAKRQQIVKLNRGDILIEKDIVITGEKGRAQLLMIDGAKIAVKPSSEIALEEYQYKQEDANVIGTSESSMTMSLIKGGFRTISGAIGAGEDKSEYKVKTPIATIGIRGTDYSALICSDSCLSLSGSGNVKGGVYFGVSKGSIVIKNDQGELILNKNQFGYVPSSNLAPVRIATPPENLMADSSNPVFDEDSETESSSEQNETNGENSSDIQVTNVDNIVPGSEDTLDIENDESNKEITGDIKPEVIVTIDGDDGDGNLVRVDNTVYDFSRAHSIAFAGAFNSTTGFSLVTNTPTESLIEEAGGITQFYAQSVSGTFATEYSLEQAQLYDVGYDPASGISWGRWSDGFIQTVADNGSVQQIDLNNSSLHWALDNNEAGQLLPITGSASYSLIGNTEPTNNLGQTGLLGSASFFADFTNQLVANQINLGIGEQVWSASGVGSIADGANWFAGLYDTVFINGVEGGAGNFSGFFASQLDPETGLPAGVGLVYNLNDSTQIINGTVIFGNPRP